MKKKKIIILIIVVIIGAIFLIDKFKFNNPEKINLGTNKYRFQNYVLNELGLEGLQYIISISENVVENYTVNSFEIKVSKNGKLESFNLVLNLFDEELNMISNAYYTYENNILEYEQIDREVDQLQIVTSYDENSDIEYLSEKVKTIPLKDQIDKSDLSDYVLYYTPNLIIESGTPIFDGREDENFQSLSSSDYNNGIGGVSDGDTNVVLTLSSSSGRNYDEHYDYVFKPIDESAPNNRFALMEQDYYISNYTLQFTRDFGVTWIDTDITTEELKETINFFNNGNVLPLNSWFLSSDESIPIAYFYGTKPALKISNDNGESWRTIELDESIEKDITKRVIGFTSATFGYMAIGTDWSMGSGEVKKIYFTYDGGYNWSEITNVPLNYSRNTLMDMMMYDEFNGIIILTNTDDINFPLIYATNDGGVTWTEVNYEADLPEEILYVTDVNEISFDGEKYSIMLGQGTDSTLKVIFTSSNLISDWSYNNITYKNIHKDG